MHILLLINFVLNKKRMQLADLVHIMSHEIKIDTIQEHTTQLQTDLQNESPVLAHNMLAFEDRMLAYVSTGDVVGLKRFLETHTHGTSGNLSENRIRHLKNFLILSVTLVSRAAIKGGLFEGEALSLADKYILHSENLFSETLF